MLVGLKDPDALQGLDEYSLKKRYGKDWQWYQKKFKEVDDKQVEKLVTEAVLKPKMKEYLRNKTNISQDAIDVADSHEFLFFCRGEEALSVEFSKALNDYSYLTSIRVRTFLLNFGDYIYKGVRDFVDYQGVKSPEQIILDYELGKKFFGVFHPIQIRTPQLFLTRKLRLRVEDKGYTIAARALTYNQLVKKMNIVIGKVIKEKKKY